MRITRLRLRNYRVYEDEVDLEIPPGLVGVYGPNGAGKSYLVESILWTLYGRSRTSNAEVRTSGVLGDCLTEVEFEHEGHLYLVRRTTSGASAVKALVHRDGLQVAGSVRDTSAYVRRVIGMDDDAFRASVFAEQKQIAEFSRKAPAERRKLVLELLGIAPVDTARDRARKDARVSREQHEQLRTIVPDLVGRARELESARSAESAASLIVGAVEEALSVATLREAAARECHDALALAAHENEKLVAEKVAHERTLERAATKAGELERELKELAVAADELAVLEPVAAGLELGEERLRSVLEVVSCESELAAIVLLEEPPIPDEEGAEAARSSAETARTLVVELDGHRSALIDEVARASEAMSSSAKLSLESHCPVCGQALGGAFEKVRAHRREELEEAKARLADLEKERTRREKAAKAREKEAVALVATLKAARAARDEYEKLLDRRNRMEEKLATKRSALSPPMREGEADSLRGEVAEMRRAREAVARIRGRLERRDAAATELDVERRAETEARAAATALQERIAALGFRPEDLAVAAVARDEAEGAATSARGRAEEARIGGAEARARAEQAAIRFADAEEQHARLREIAEEARHRGRVAELLSSFRNTLVASVGPRLSAQASEVFAELTDREYDQLEVDPDTYEIKILDTGRAYGMDRFSGSETDLANLALRVAISEHVRLQSGGQVGLLVLDEIFSPLDADRKDRMLQALERLRGRFRQVLVVTHDHEIKEQLPHAIEVVKLPGRRARARLMEA